MLGGSTLSDPVKEIRGRETEVREVPQREETRYEIRCPAQAVLLAWQIPGARGGLRKFLGGQS